MPNLMDLRKKGSPINNNKEFWNNAFGAQYQAMRKEDSVKLTPQQQKIFDNWFKTGKLMNDDKKAKKFYGALKKKNSMNVAGIAPNYSSINTLVEMAIVFGGDQWDYFMDKSFEMDISATAGAAVYYFSNQLYRYAFNDKLVKTVMENAGGLRGFDQYLEGIAAEYAESTTAGYHCFEHVNNLYHFSILNAFQIPSVKRAVKKAAEAQLNEFLHLKSYKIIGLNTLSRTMEALYAYNGFENIPDIDRGICALVYLLLCIEKPIDVAIYSCYAEFIMTHVSKVGDELSVDEQRMKHSTKIVENSEASIQDEIDYIYEHNSEFKKRLNQNDFLTPIAVIYEINKFLEVECVASLIRKNMDDILVDIFYKYGISEWNAMPIEDRAWAVYQVALCDQLLNNDYSFRMWACKNRIRKSDDEAEAPIIISDSHEKKISEKKQSEEITSDFSEITKASERIKEFERENKLLKTQLKEFKLENHDLKDNLDEIQSDKESEKLSQEEREELNRLREFVFSLKSEEANESNKKIDEDVIRNAGQIVLLGGHTTLYRRLMNKYSNIRCIDGRTRVSFDMIQNADYVFFLFDFLSHGTYYQGCNECSKHNVPFGYIQGTNLEKAERQIIECIQNSDKATA